MPNAQEFSTAWWILFLPLIGFLVQAFLGKRAVQSMGAAAGRRVMGTLATLFIAVPFVIGLMLTLKLSNLGHESRSIVLHGLDWINVLSLRVPFELVIDPLSMTMVLIITGIGSLIHLYATGYMGDDRDYPRFFTYLNLFVASMLILVMGNNLALLFIGWEGVGVCSYLLIGYWYKDVANAKAANKAFIVNRIGDWGLTLGIFAIFCVLAGNVHSSAFPDGRFLSYDRMLPVLGEVLMRDPWLATTIGLLLFVGACGKSAQFPLYLWLPDAMAGPTPVSALIHAATMVTSGVVLLNRMHIVFENSPVASAVVTCIGAFTALFAALVAFGQTDIKKVLAYSTVSQLGFMFIGAGAGAYWSGMFHVTTHAFFKALLFLGSGAVIYAMAHNQDMRNYGKLFKYLKITGTTMFIGFLAISGVYGFAGFYSKEAILGYALGSEHAAIEGVLLGQFAGGIGLFAAALTAMYMTRMTWLTFFGNEERWRSIPVHEHHHDGHESETHGEDHHEHAHVEGHDHGPDVHGFFYEHPVPEEHEHHHELDGSHTPKEVPPSMWVPLVVLALLSVVGGFLMENNHAFEHWLEPSSGPTVIGSTLSPHPEYLPISLVTLSLIAALGGILVGWLVYRKGLPKSEGWDLAKWSPFRRAAGDQFGYDRAMVSASVEGGAQLGWFAWRGIDVSIIDRIVNGVAGFAGLVGRGFRTSQTGFIRSYALWMLAGGLGLLIWLLTLSSSTMGMTSKEAYQNELNRKTRESKIGQFPPQGIQPSR
jgi:NADH-quinone oxidoreductase subunit L